MPDPSGSLAVGTIGMGLFGGLALFLAGMDQMSQALRAVAGDGMRTILAKLTGNRVTAALTGAIVTAILQSSSVTTVLVVGFISAGIMSLSQSIGIIMGANVGTTITAQIIAFEVTKYALLMIAVGFGLNFAVKVEKVKQYGTMLMGLGLIFFGMGIMSDATRPLRTYEPFIDVMRQMDNPLLGILVGAAFTALVQSSSATTGIVIVLAGQGFITLEAGIAIAFGANVGTCVTAVLAALGKPTEARRAAAVHVIFNVLGVLFWVFLIDYLADYVRLISPQSPELEGTERLAAETPRQIANAHTAFNVFNTLFFIWFTGPLARIVERLIREKPEVVPDAARPKFLDDVYLQTPPLALDRIALELGRLGEGVTGMLRDAPTAFRSGDRAALQDIERRNSDATRLYEAICSYMARLSQSKLSARRGHRLSSLGEIANTMDHAGDTIVNNLVRLGYDRLEAGIEPSEVTVEAFDPLVAAVEEAYVDVIAALRDEDPVRARKVIDDKAKIQDLARDLDAHLGRRLSEQGPDRVAAYRLETDAVEILKRLYYFAKRIAKELVDEEGALARTATIQRPNPV